MGLPVWEYLQFLTTEAGKKQVGSVLDPDKTKICSDALMNSFRRMIARVEAKAPTFPPPPSSVKVIRKLHPSPVPKSLIMFWNDAVVLPSRCPRIVRQSSAFEPGMETSLTWKHESPRCSPMTSCLSTTTKPSLQLTMVMQQQLTRRISIFGSSHRGHRSIRTSRQTIIAICGLSAQAISFGFHICTRHFVPLLEWVLLSP